MDVRVARAKRPVRSLGGSVDAIEPECPISARDAEMRLDSPVGWRSQVKVRPPGAWRRAAVSNVWPSAEGALGQWEGGERRTFISAARFRAAALSSSS